MANGRSPLMNSTDVCTKMRSQMRFPGRKLSAPRPEPPGVETRILKSLARWTLWGSLFIVEPSIFARLFDWNSRIIDVELTLTSIDIGVVAVLILYWTVLFTVGLGAVIVKVMKGHVYLADSYPLQDSERPHADRHWIG